MRFRDETLSDLLVEYRSMERRSASSGCFQNPIPQGIAEATGRGQHDHRSSDAIPIACPELGVEIVGCRHRIGGSIDQSRVGTHEF